MPHRFNDDGELLPVPLTPLQQATEVKEIMFGISVLVGMIAENKRREAWIDSMPEEEQEKIRAEDAKKARDELAHRRALEVAEAGRARNFWGD
jgi:hypothetical protein